MPVYSLTSNKKISESNKQRLVNMFTDVHCDIMVAPEQFVHILFSDGIPLFKKKKLYVHANVRKGRTEQAIAKLKTTLTSECAKIMNIRKDEVYINFMEIRGKWAMEGGYVMPDPGEENEWMEKVMAALALKEKSLVK